MSIEDLTSGVRDVSMNDEPELPECLLFKPQKDTFDNVPRYLFRAVFPFSKGQTNERWVRSEAACQNNPSSLKDIFSSFYDGEQQDVAYTLNQHLRWWEKHKANDNFVSWTSSLLFALQYIHYRHIKDRCSLSDVKLYVVDTEQFERGAFIRDKDIMEPFLGLDDPGFRYNLEKMWRLRNKPTWYFGEYLSQGSMKIAGKCQVVSAEAVLGENRLGHVQPHFQQMPKNPDWAREVDWLRKSIWGNPPLSPLSSEEVHDAKMVVEQLTDQFDHGWKLPMAIYFWALTGETLCDAHQPFFDIFESIYRLEKKNGRPSPFKVIAPDTMPELKFVKDVADNFYGRAEARYAIST
ncbi:hypothetical protein ASPWEDRAFT_23054 [Aspergillus wentii DTO 134E9]|uniref:DUF7587 domain-containing protein n=1 Tax=Aspergillus wentii DTO 134E9 TaxID=1073089 RepID=A0A1L9S1C6_ASPWE|nr:uncharacterized protein ASPWEDRAFT_23054 [Aspergillus wentii DTO 134E9]OJJ40923.1 hypothetical protein ASPWEDRAFT_23054 [Aspergillus wentii DTO 134E9]